MDGGLERSLRLVSTPSMAGAAAERRELIAPSKQPPLCYAVCSVQASAMYCVLLVVATASSSSIC